MLDPRYTNQYESEILDLIDHQNDFTRSDLQGMVTLLVNRIMEEGHQLLSKLESDSGSSLPI
jgi:hypothetical protein